MGGGGGGGCLVVDQLLQFDWGCDKAVDSTPVNFQRRFDRIFVNRNKGRSSLDCHQAVRIIGRSTLNRHCGWLLSRVMLCTQKKKKRDLQQVIITICLIVIDIDGALRTVSV